ncbi:Crp/Fnr family transcriptional regulator [Waterburya agarophytonicola K14]|uniref:Crp/Fnr family transcriptional regulator n=1 Tax=Waterburya agarophytonicola KI4 TaxID=2874699 RepID=A0A964BTQ8_9CYAN|nr:Crp/Fnr family transcriptional regulator [Waterburya agarophytonicola]MCC0178959.1 Crp/Fnr family transcriptional regulator [Waterburya agarophytonicola KI4]
MIVKGCSSTSQLQQISIFQDLAINELDSLIPYSYVREYQQQEIVMHEGDRLPQQLHALISGKLEIKKTAESGKETIVRLIPPGELFAAPAMFGDGIAPAMVVCQVDSAVLTIERDVLLQVIAHSPEISLKIIQVFNQRLQQLHHTVHGLISERAIVRLIRLLQYYGDVYGYASQICDGTQNITEGELLQIRLPYYQLARSIGISYEECVRLFKQLKGIVSYQRGGTIIILDRSKLAALRDTTK